MQRVRPSSEVLSLGAILVTVVAWASAFVAIRSVGEHFEPGALALGRLLIGSVALGLLVALRRSWVWPTRREWLLVVVCGITWFAVYNIALNAAERRVDAGTTAMLVAVGPILLAVLAGFVLREGFARWLLIGLAVAFAGVVLIGISTSSSGHADLAGVALCMVAAAAYAVGVLAQKPTLRRLPALQVTWLSCVVAMIVSLPFSGQLVDGLRAAPSSALLGIVYLGAIPMALAFTTWAYALARMDAGRLGATIYVVPPMAVLLGWLLLGETPTALAIVGGVVCLVGVGLSKRRPRPRRPVPVAAAEPPSLAVAPAAES